MDALLHSVAMHGTVLRSIGCSPSTSAPICPPLYSILPRTNKALVQRTLKRSSTPTRGNRAQFIACNAALTADQQDISFALPPNADRKPKILIAGAGIGGLVRFGVLDSSTDGLLVGGGSWCTTCVLYTQVLAVGLLKKGFEVQVFERDMTAIRGEGKYRGPIQVCAVYAGRRLGYSVIHMRLACTTYHQVQSNALAALEALDAEVAAEVMATGCITGDRINGLCDGETGDWYVTWGRAVDGL